MLRKKEILLVLVFSSLVNLTNHVPAGSDRFNLVSVEHVLRKNPTITYQACMEAQPFTYAACPWPLCLDQHSCSGMLGETFVLQIPHGRVSSSCGFVVVDERYMLRELVKQSIPFSSVMHFIFSSYIPTNAYHKFSGKVAVIAQMRSDGYAHWLMETLGRLAILEMAGIEYDWLYVLADQQYMQDSLRLWGITSDKIIDPRYNFYSIEADELIVPSQANRRVSIPEQNFQSYVAHCSIYYPVQLVEYIRNKFIPLAQRQVSDYNFSKKIFIVSHDVNGLPTSMQEQLFSRLSTQGFVRYELSTISFLEQVVLFNNAETIIAAHGSGLANLMFCKPGAQVFEVFNTHVDVQFCYLAQTLGLVYGCCAIDDYIAKGSQFVPFQVE